MENNNLPQVNVAEFTRIIKMQLDEENYRPVFGLGKGGIGKTESIKDLAEELGIGYIDIRLLLYNETDLKGIPYPDKDHTMTIWLQNNILPNPDKDKEKGILVFDEITSCAKSVRTAAYQLLNERKLGEYVLPDGWLVVCLGNGEEDGGDYNGMEGNFANRCSVYHVVADVDAWLDWAVKPHGKNHEPVNELVTTYIKFNRAALHTFDPDDENNLLFASPRSWKAVSDILNAYKREDKSFYDLIFQDDTDERNKLLKCRIEANIGDNTAPDFFAMCRNKIEIDPMEIINGSESAMNFQPENLFVASIVVDTIRTYLAPKICEEMTDGETEDANKVSEETSKGMANFLAWLGRLNKEEQKTMGYMDFLRYDKKKLMKFLTQNNSILKFAGENEDVQKFLDSPVFQ